ncbi:MAG: hypothetical protein ABIJ19_00025 [Patescibacteria group bacterium]
MDRNKIAKATPINADFLLIKGIRDTVGFLKFIDWMATPKYLREPEYQKDFAVQIEVSEDTLTDWKKHPQFFQLMQLRISNWIKERVPDVIGALYENASTAGKAKDVEMFLHLAGAWMRKKDSK